MQVRREAAIALSSHRFQKDTGSIRDQIIEFAANESDPETLISLIKALRKTEVPSKILDAWFKHPSPLVRTACIKTFPKHRAVKDMISDESFHVRLTAITSLSKSGKSLKSVVRKGATISALEDSKMGRNTYMAEAVAVIEAARVGEFSPFPLLAIQANGHTCGSCQTH